MKRGLHRLRLERETIRALGAERLAEIGPAGGIPTTPTADPWTCPNTVTNPPLHMSGFCEPRTNQCETELCH